MGFTVPSPTGLTGWGDDLMTLALALRAERIEKKKMADEKEDKQQARELQARGLDIQQQQIEQQNVQFEKGYELDVERLGLDRQKATADIAQSTASASYTNTLADIAKLQKSMDEQTKEYKRQSEVAKARGATTEADMAQMQYDALKSLGPEGQKEFFTSQKVIANMRAEQQAQDAESRALRTQIDMYSTMIQQQQLKQRDVSQKFDQLTGGGSLTKDLLPSDRIDIEGLFMNLADTMSNEKADPNAIVELRQAAYDKVRAAEDRAMNVSEQKEDVKAQRALRGDVSQALITNPKLAPQWDGPSLKEAQTNPNTEFRTINKDVFELFGKSVPNPLGGPSLIMTRKRAEELGLINAWLLAPSPVDQMVDMASRSMAPTSMRQPSDETKKKTSSLRD